MNQAANKVDKYVERSGLLKLSRVTGYTDPVRFTSKEQHLRPLFEEIQAHSASDIFVVEGKPISVLINNDLYAATWRIIDKSEAHWILHEIAGKDALSSISSQKSINTSFGLFDNQTDRTTLAGYRIQNNYRVNASGILTQGVSSFQIVLRAIPADPLDYQKIGLNLKFVERCCPTKGIVLIAGVTGSGKSTTLSSIIKYILENDTPIKGNLICHEEPIEFTYENVISHHSIIVQSQIPECFKSFPAANREAMRRKPAGILVGELRDTETISAAIEASLTGHPAFATIHSSSISDIISRIVGLHPSEEKESALFNILCTAKMLIAQRLVKKTDGKLMAVQEYLYITDQVRKDMLNLGSPLEQNVNNYIESLMNASDGSEEAIASKTFKQQGHELFNARIISEQGLTLLTGDS